MLKFSENNCWQQQKWKTWHIFSSSSQKKKKSQIFSKKKNEWMPRINSISLCFALTEKKNVYYRENEDYSLCVW